MLVMTMGPPFSALHPVMLRKEPPGCLCDCSDIALSVERWHVCAAIALLRRCLYSTFEHSVWSLLPARWWLPSNLLCLVMRRSEYLNHA